MSALAAGLGGALALTLVEPRDDAPGSRIVEPGAIQAILRVGFADVRALALR